MRWVYARIAFWAMWTAWLCAIQYLLLDWLGALPAVAALALVILPPLLFTVTGSFFGPKHPAESRSSLLWKGVAGCCALSVFANMVVLRAIPGTTIALPFVLLLSALIMLRRGSIRKLTLRDGELVDRVRQIAALTGVSVSRVIVFASPRNRPAAFAHRAGAILISDSLLRLLSKPEMDAVIGHEAAHLRRSQTVVHLLLPLAAAATVAISQFRPAITGTAPFWPLLLILLWRALRRQLEFHADAVAARSTAAPEALITALVRVSSAAGLPLDWGWLTGLFLAHPPMRARFRSLAKRAGMTPGTVEQLIASVALIPQAPGYVSPLASPATEEPPVLVEHYRRVGNRLTALSAVFPIVAGAAASASAALWRGGLDALGALTVAWIGGGILVYYVLYEILVGTERRHLLLKIAGRAQARGFFVGISTAAEARQYGNSYHYDVGIATIDDGSLRFEGTRCSWVLCPSEVRRVWIARGPRHWTPRRVVCIEYQSGAEDNAAVISLQSFDSWFWPATSRATKSLFAAVQAWSQNRAASADTTVPPPQVAGEVVQRIRPAAVWKALRRPCLISLAAAWFLDSLVWSPYPSPIAPFIAPLLTAALICFVLAPHIDWTQPRPNR